MTVAFNEAEKRRQFHELVAKKKAIHAQTDPIRDQMAEIAKQEAELAQRRRDLAAQAREIEAGLFEIDQEIAFLARGLGGKTGTAEG